MWEHHVQRERAYEPLSLFLFDKVHILQGRRRWGIEVEFARDNTPNPAGPYASLNGSKRLLMLLDVCKAGRAALAARRPLGLVGCAEGRTGSLRSVTGGQGRRRVCAIFARPASDRSLQTSCKSAETSPGKTKRARRRDGRQFLGGRRSLLFCLGGGESVSTDNVVMVYEFFVINQDFRGQVLQRNLRVHKGRRGLRGGKERPCEEATVRSRWEVRPWEKINQMGEVHLFILVRLSNTGRNLLRHVLPRPGQFASVCDAL